MSLDQILVTVSGLLLSVIIAWYFWFAPKGRAMATVGAGGAQEVAITVKGGYSPDLVVVKAEIGRAHV